MNASGANALDREKFSTLLASYSRAYERFLENGFKSAAALMIVLGWLIGSNNADNFFGNNYFLLAFAILMMCASSFFLVATFTRLRALSRRLRQKLDDLSYMGANYYEQHEISQVIYWSVVGQNFLLCALIISVLASFYP